MPTVLPEGPCRFYFVSADTAEPAHIHVWRNEGFAKFWLNPAFLQNIGNLGSRELRRIRQIVEQRQSEFLEAWNDYFDH